MPEITGIGEIFTKFKQWTAPRKNPVPVMPQQAIIDKSPVAQPTPIIPEKKIDVPALGTLFQQQISSLPESCLPPIFEESGGAPAFLSTNEGMPSGMIERISNDENHPDGYIFGAGFGNILSLVSLYGEENEPKAILSVDVLPEVVLLGKMMTQAILESADFNTFYQAIKNTDYLKQLHETVMGGDEPQVIKDRYAKVSFDSLSKDIQDVVGREYIPRTGNDKSAVSGEGRRIVVLASIRDNWKRLHHMAETGNIGIALGDITNQQVLDVVKRMPEFTASRNIVYMSNIIDHLTRRGTDLSQISAMKPLATLESDTENGNWFVDTTQNSLNYQLRAQQKLPQYTVSDVQY